MGKASECGSVERDGFTGTVYEREDGKKFVAWDLARFSAADGREAQISGITGEGGSPKAAAWNLDKSENRSYLMRLLGARAYVTGAGAGVSYYIPGAAIQVHGYDEALSLTLEARVGSRQDKPLALAQMADVVAKQVARGVYALYTSRKGSEPESKPESAEDLSEIPF